MSKFYDKLISANTYLSAGERQALLQQLDGRNFNNLDAISAAEHAFGELVRTGIQSEGELAKILRLVHIDPADLWENCYGVCELGGYYDGPFGRVDAGDPEADRRYVEIREEEERFMAPILERRAQFLSYVDNVVMQQPLASPRFLLRNFDMKYAPHEKAIEKIVLEQAELDPATDFPFIVGNVKVEQIRLIAAQSEQTSADVLRQLLKDDFPAVVRAAQTNLLHRALADEKELIELLLQHQKVEIREYASQRLIQSGLPPTNMSFPPPDLLTSDLKSWLLQHNRSTPNQLQPLLGDSDPNIAISAAERLTEMPGQNPWEIFDRLLRNNNSRAQAYAAEHWPTDSPFLPNLFSAFRFPLSLSGYQSPPFKDVKSSDELKEVLRRVSRETESYEETGWLGQGVIEYLLQYNPSIERDLILLAHQFPMYGRYPAGNYPASSAILSKVRARRALGRVRRRESYHTLANLYYALKYGSGTMASDNHAWNVTNALMAMKKRMVTRPRVLVLGFSTNFSIENVAAILRLVGFKTAEISAIDIAREPLQFARESYPKSIFGFPIRYRLADARALPFENQGFDLVVTHLLLTHLKHEDKQRVLQEIRTVLGPNAEFVDEEIVAQHGFNIARYRSFYRTLGENYPGSSAEKDHVGNLMVKLGSHPHFYPYERRADLETDLRSAGLEFDFPLIDERKAYEGRDTIIKFDRYQIRAQAA